MRYSIFFLFVLLSSLFSCSSYCSSRNVVSNDELIHVEQLEQDENTFYEQLKVKLNYRQLYELARERILERCDTECKAHIVYYSTHGNGEAGFAICDNVPLSFDYSCANMKVNQILDELREISEVVKTKLTLDKLYEIAKECSSESSEKTRESTKEPNTTLKKGNYIIPIETNKGRRRLLITSIPFLFFGFVILTLVLFLCCYKRRSNERKPLVMEKEYTNKQLDKVLKEEGRESEREKDIESGKKVNKRTLRLRSRNISYYIH
jgi:hypothetical protein